MKKLNSLPTDKASFIIKTEFDKIKPCISFDPHTALNHLTQSNNGSGRLRMMTGANNFAKSMEESFIQFTFKGSKNYNWARLGLNGMDEYVLILGKKNTMNAYMKGKPFLSAIKTGLPLENMKAYFEEETGLYLSL
jgi:hypothetical protein